MKRTFLLFALALMLFACNKDSEQIDSAIENKDSSITFRSSIAPESRVYDDTFDTGDQIYVSAYQDSTEVVAKNILYTYDGTLFSSTSPITQVEGVEYSYVATYPAVDILSSGTIFTLSSNQSSYSGFSQSDLLVSVHEATSDLCPTLYFNHKMSSIVINITESSMAGGVMTLYAKNLSTIDITSNSYTDYGSTVAITPYSTDGSYKAIVAPQSFNSGDLMATYELNGVTYQWEIDYNVDFVSGYRYTYNWDIVEGDVTYEGYISGWYDEEITNDVVADDVVVSVKDYSEIFLQDIYTWELVVGDNGETTGLWQDSVLGSVFYFGSVAKEVEFYRATDYISDNGYELYRIKDVYTTEYLVQLYNALNADAPLTTADFIDWAEYGYADDEPMYNYIFINKDSGSAYFPYQSTNFYNGEYYGFLRFASYCDIYFTFEAGYEDLSKYGEYADGIVSFPSNSIYCQLTEYDGGSAWLNTIQHYIVLPGYSSSFNVDTDDDVAALEVKSNTTNTVGARTSLRATNTAIAKMQLK